MFSCLSAHPTDFGTFLPTQALSAAEGASQNHHLRVTTRALGCVAQVMTEIDLTHSSLEFINTVPDTPQCQLSPSMTEKPDR